MPVNSIKKANNKCILVQSLGGGDKKFCEERQFLLVTLTTKCRLSESLCTLCFRLRQNGTSKTLRWVFSLNRQEFKLGQRF